MNSKSIAMLAEHLRAEAAHDAAAAAACYHDDGWYQHEAFNLRFQAATSQLEKPSRVKEVRRDIARIKTLQNERSRSSAK